MCLLAGPEDLAAFETDVLAQAATGLSDRTISLDVTHLDQVRAWFGRPLWEMRPADADEYFGKVMRAAARSTRLSRAQAPKTYFAFLELRHKGRSVHGETISPPLASVGGVKLAEPHRARRVSLIRVTSIARYDQVADFYVDEVGDELTDPATAALPRLLGARTG